MKFHWPFFLDLPQFAFNLPIAWPRADCSGTHRSTRFVCNYLPQKRKTPLPFGCGALFRVAFSYYVVNPAPL
jgi:hypothetical protein